MDLPAADPDDPRPPYEQLRSAIAERVADGRLAAGTRLPTVRGLAGDVGLAVNTVARVYRELEADGVVVTEGRRGTFVATSDGAADLHAAVTAYVDAARRAGVTAEEAAALVTRSWSATR
ncbi:GntR family transcriptional regulator [Nocardioides sp. CFH 31398]|uniref:GntR family transcriptional regulator n=1 Tax=Nocardioides sp. CFH 31398 TaxID=2919579 RepID=UPI001F054E85|nr:GntR family transcriptional regulator [Nocardioides sp. CFH 31398]MCH1869000.1 GntR family transcriptional regulator [Nocardioides sp. CFH 31398]